MSIALFKEKLSHNRRHNIFYHIREFKKQTTDTNSKSNYNRIIKIIDLHDN